MFFRKKKPEGQPEENTRETIVLYLYIAEDGWKARLTGPDGAPMGDDIVKAVSDHKLDGSERTEYVIKDAIKQFPKRRLRDVGSIHILLDDPDVLIIDGKEQKLKAPNPLMLRELGARKLNVEQTTYGTRNFGLSGRREGKASEWATWDVASKDGDDNKGDIYAFLESSKLENYLSQLDAVALKLTSVVPTVDVLLRRIEAFPQVPSAAIYMADQNTYIAMGFPDMGMASVRTIPTGVISIADAVAKAQSVNTKDALTALSNRDYLSSIELNVAKSGEADLTRSVYDRALSPLFTEFFGEINDTFEYFSQHRAAGPISSVEIIGALDRVNGIRELFERNIKSPVTFPTEGLLDMFLSHVKQGSGNLLSGSDGSLLSVGRTQYSFSENKFVETEELAKQKAEIETERSSKIPEGRVSRLRRNKKLRKDKKSKIGKSAKSGGTKTKKEGFFSRTRRAKAGTRASGTRYQGPEMDQVVKKQDRAGVVLVLLTAFSILYFASMQFDSISVEHQKSVSRLATKINDGIKNRQEINKKGAARSSVLPVADKVLWSEKFMSLADNMDKAMWITDVYLSDEQRTVGGETVLSKKLVLEGAVLPTTIGHILNIAQYIERLLKDEKFFMNDFREITFEGAEIDASESDHIVRFTLDAWYDENKRNRLSTGADEPMTVDKMQSNVDKRTRVLEKKVP